MAAYFARSCPPLQRDRGPWRLRVEYSSVSGLPTYRLDFLIDLPLPVLRFGFERLGSMRTCVFFFVMKLLPAFGVKRSKSIQLPPYGYAGQVA